MAGAEGGGGLVSQYFKPICYGDKILAKKLDIGKQTNENFYNNIDSLNIKTHNWNETVPTMAAY